MSQSGFNLAFDRVGIELASQNLSAMFVYGLFSVLVPYDGYQLRKMKT